MMYFYPPGRHTRARGVVCHLPKGGGCPARKKIPKSHYILWLFEEIDFFRNRSSGFFFRTLDIFLPLASNLWKI